MLGESDPGMVTELMPSPALIPAKASVPPSPSVPKDPSPVVHCRSAYKNIAKDSNLLVASTHWNVFVYTKQQYNNVLALLVTDYLNLYVLHVQRPIIKLGQPDNVFC